MDALWGRTRLAQAGSGRRAADNDGNDRALQARRDSGPMDGAADKKAGGDADRGSRVEASDRLGCIDFGYLKDPGGRKPEKWQVTGMSRIAALA